jgi:hypothetical protein
MGMRARGTVSDDAPKPPAGWYPSPEGTQRYWDGERWLSLPAPESSAPNVTAPAMVAPTPKHSKRGLIIASVVVAAVLVIGGGSALAWKVVNDQQVAAAAQEAAEVAAAKAAAEKKAEDRAAAAAAAAEKSERANRAAAVPGVEESIRVMAEGHISDGVIDGPVLSVDCSPVNGGSTDDLTEQTTVFACFVANVDNGDGTFTGYNYNATMNWTTGSYTYGLGAP